jgi:hypothetical protein
MSPAQKGNIESMENNKQLQKDKIKNIPVKNKGKERGIGFSNEKEIHLASEKVLAKEWLLKKENKAWSSL